MIKNIDVLADRLKGVKVGEENLTPEKLIALLKDEKEVELAVTPVHLLDETQLTELKTNIGKEKYEEGKTAGSEMFAKDLKKKFGIEKEGKSLDVVSSYLTEKLQAEASKEPNQKITELTESLSALQKKYETDVTGFNETIIGLKKNIEQRDIDFYMQSNMPQLNGILPKHALTVYKSERQFAKDEAGNLNILVGGKVLKDNLEKPVDFATDFTNFAKQYGWTGEAGRGGGNTYGSSSNEFKTMNDLMKHMKDNKIDPTKPEGLEMIKNFTEAQK